METLQSSRARYAKKPTKSQHIHSPSHLLADELATRLRDKRHFGFYLKMALTHDHAMLRKLAGEVLESPSVRSPGKLFAFLLKKQRLDQDSPA